MTLREFLRSKNIILNFNGIETEEEDDDEGSNSILDPMQVLRCNSIEFKDLLGDSRITTKLPKLTSIITSGVPARNLAREYFDFMKTLKCRYYLQPDHYLVGGRLFNLIDHVARGDTAGCEWSARSLIAIWRTFRRGSGMKVDSSDSDDAGSDSLESNAWWTGVKRFYG